MCPPAAPPRWPLQALAPAELRPVDPGGAVVRQGDPSTHLFVVHDGAVRLGVLRPDGVEAVLEVLGPGGAFGFAGLGLPAAGLGAVEPAEARAVAPTRVLAFAHDDLRLLVGRRPGLALRLLELSATRLAATGTALAETLLGDVRGRVVHRLARLAAAHGRPFADGVRIELWLSQEELAKLVGATRESVNRVLGDLRRDGLVSVDDDGRYVLTPRGLRASPAGSRAGTGRTAGLARARGVRTARTPAAG
jgi:CRP-like cAMP-binding protein